MFQRLRASLGKFAEILLSGPAWASRPLRRLTRAALIGRLGRRTKWREHEYALVELSAHALFCTCSGLEVAQSPRQGFTARQECFESRLFEVKRNGGVLSAVSRLVARDFGGGWSSQAERKRPWGREAPPTALMIAILVVEPTHALPDRALWHRRDLIRHQLRLPLEPIAPDNDVQSEVPHLCPIAWLANAT